ncbi:FAD-dependent oxidoreductase [candidate division KSB1 bacterium]|nr:FAD-dependent oxidoreductase [candidate division KSB1 bacterium]NIR70177.1 FAD-dependent oxidoreductase [candidate division KSB1 bacterium]NIS27563.1 FAD-dependent oxidoreductase [candidate division KSB1 bacterium]NIT74416.1 FAD-dependent oxidoreductase [candidate division KSB1 bacterium]NIU28281.1 FAD-dependent oxidoreductase [candidate division KSB1 bacterium]
MNSKTRNERFVVIGGCAAGMSAASKAKRLNPNLEVLAFERTAHVSYSACGIPYYIADLVREARELVTITPEEFREKRGIQVFGNHQVVTISPVQRKVTAIDLRSQTECEFDYDKLMISVGGIPNRPNIPGMQLRNVFTIQTLQDGINIRRYVDERKPKRVAIIGGGYIAMEMAEAFRRRFIEVTVIEREKQILPSFEPNIVENVTEKLKRHDVSIRTGSRVQALDGKETQEVVAVRLQESQSMPTDFVLVCSGVRPNTELATMAGVRLGKTGAITVDRKMQSNVPNIYAAGDCIEVKNLVSGKPDYVPLGPAANKQGRVAGENIGGGTATFNGVVGTSVFKTFGLEVARTGLNVKQARDLGYAVDSVHITDNSKAGYYPGSSPITITVVFDQRSGRLLGAQMVGKEGVSKRIDIFAAALTNKMTLDEMAYMDLSYAPPFAPVWDPVLVAVNVAKGHLK